MKPLGSALNAAFWATADRWQPEPTIDADRFTETILALEEKRLERLRKANDGSSKDQPGSDAAPAPPAPGAARVRYHAATQGDRADAHRRTERC
jgi:hypothetical protein